MRKLALLPLMTALAACESGITADAQPSVSVLKQDGGCFALMTPDTPVSTTLGVSGTCNYRAEPRLLAGLDLIEVVVDYGEDIDFAGAATAPTPDVDVTVDGVHSDVPVEISNELRVGSRAYLGDVGLALRHHGGHRALGLLGVRVADQLDDLRRDDLP